MKMRSYDDILAVSQNKTAGSDFIIFGISSSKTISKHSSTNFHSQDTFPLTCNLKVLHDKPSGFITIFECRDDMLEN